jgi:hypothetical protein
MKKGPSKTEAPESIEILAEDIETGADEIAKLPARLLRYATAHERAMLNLAHLRLKTEVEDMPVLLQRWLLGIQTRLANCGNYLGFRHYYTVGKVRLTVACFCKVHLLCPLCAIRRGSKVLETLVAKHAAITAEHPHLKMYMLTLTVKNGPDLAERHAHLKKGFQQLLDRRRTVKKGNRGNTEFAKIKALVGSYETTKPDDWHPHLHLMILTDSRLNAAKLKAEWHDITGDSHVLRLDRAKHPKNPALDFLEICKYALKFGDLTPEQNLEAFMALRQKQLLVTAGLFRGIRIPEELTDIPLDELPYFDMLYRFIEGKGYSWVADAAALAEGAVAGGRCRDVVTNE